MQLNEFNANIKLASGILNRCPSCMNNLVRHICEFTCSPRQSKFIEVKKTGVNPDTKSEFFLQTLKINNLHLTIVFITQQRNMSTKLTSIYRKIILMERTIPAVMSYIHQRVN